MRFAGSESAMASMFGDMGSPEYDQQAAVGIEGNSLQRQMRSKSEAMALGAANMGKSAVASAEAQAEAIEAQGAAQGQASMASGLAGGIGSIAKGFGSMMGTGGGVTPASSVGKGISFGGIKPF